MTRVLVAAGLAALVSTGALGEAQTRERPAAAPSGEIATLAAGWNALAAGRQDEAARAADAVLQQRPWDHAAIVLKVHALSAQSANAGLTAYEQWLVGARVDDVGVLEPVVIAVLREIAAGADEQLRRDALTALAAAKVDGAAQQLASLQGSGRGTLDHDLAAARGGDVAALQRLSEMTDPRQHPRNAALAAELPKAGAAAAPALMALLGSPDGETRAAAARSLGILRADQARAALQQLSSDPDPRVRTNATVALAKLGDTKALESVDRMLASGVPDIQLVAAETWEGQPGPWTEVIRPLLDNPDGLTRIHAARMIAPVDPEAARRALTTALADANPVMRAEAGSAIASLDTNLAAADVPTLRKRLRERDPLIRLAAANALLRVVHP